MAFESSSPFMSLPIPGVGLTDGPQYATDLNNCFTIIDAHTHVAGSGQLITPSAININSDLSFSNNNLTQARSVRFFAQSVPLAGVTDLDCVYTAGVDLYYNDGNGNQIQMTQSGGVAGSPGSIGNLVSPASVTYVVVGTTYVFQSDVNKAANLDIASIILRKTTTSSNGITLSVPSGLASDYTITMPALPGSTQAMTLASTGIIGTITYDAIGQAMTSTGANAIANTRTRTTGSATVAAGGVAISPNCSNFSTTSTTLVDVTNLSVTITTTGRAVMIMLQPSDGVFIGGNFSYIATQSITPVSESEFAIIRNSTNISYQTLAISVGSGDTPFLEVPPSTIMFVDTATTGSPGTYTYKLQARTLSARVYVYQCQLIAYEL